MNFLKTIPCDEGISTARDNLITNCSRWLAMASSVLLALLSWYCLLSGIIAGAAVSSVAAFVILLLALFFLEVMVRPVRFFLLCLDQLFICLQGLFLLLAFFLVITPMGLFVNIFNTGFVSKGMIRRTRKYSRKSPGSYWKCLGEQHVSVAPHNVLCLK